MFNATLPRMFKVISECYDKTKFRTEFYCEPCYNYVCRKSNFEPKQETYGGNYKVDNSKDPYSHVINSKSYYSYYNSI